MQKEIEEMRNEIKTLRMCHGPYLKSGGMGVDPLREL